MPRLRGQLPLERQDLLVLRLHRRCDRVLSSSASEGRVDEPALVLLAGVAVLLSVRVERLLLVEGLLRVEALLLLLLVLEGGVDVPAHTLRVLLGRRVMVRRLGLIRMMPLLLGATCGRRSVRGAEGDRPRWEGTVRRRRRRSERGLVLLLLGRLLLRVRHVDSTHRLLRLGDVGLVEVAVVGVDRG